MLEKFRANVLKEYVSKKIQAIFRIKEQSSETAKALF